jgi:hypothetical protein
MCKFTHVLNTIIIVLDKNSYFLMKFQITKTTSCYCMHALVASSKYKLVS